MSGGKQGVLWEMCKWQINRKSRRYIFFPCKSKFHCCVLTLMFIAILEHSGSNSSYEKQCDILKLMIHLPVIVSTGTRLLSGEKGQILGQGQEKTN